MLGLVAFLLAQSPYDYTTKSGAAVRLVSVSDDYAMRSWSPNGSPHAKWLSNAVVMEDRHSSMNPDFLIGKLSLLFVVDHPSDPNFSYDFDGTSADFSEWGAIPADFGFVMTRVHNPPQIRAVLKKAASRESIDVQLHFSDRPWKIEGDYIKATNKLSGNLTLPALSIVNNSPNYKWVGVAARVKKVEPGRRYELFLLDTKGKPFESQLPTRRPSDPGRVEVAYRLLGKPLGRVVLRSRPMETFRFSGVHLTPKG